MSNEEWKKLNTVRQSVRLNRNTDADIIEALANAPSKHGFLKAAMRYYVAHGCPPVERPKKPTTDTK